MKMTDLLTLKVYPFTLSVSDDSLANDIIGKVLIQTETNFWLCMRSLSELTTFI